ncbi:tRNA 4-thiouridine(8) synthase ThiI [Methanotrichaceae archaeon M04Ac]|uniref:Probable tRNA sulfurtransferase n=1 Tax=Candidatus Methanocrinis alkalitolerans TaxID=3033395 RepID=A0ABT5XH73_9EURY|nr:tRNA uracil 4-sulfurtransferase ThiI [Candidatus Methanocrinis alkalitolerans]MDF0594054.1 tRNA 4-thiouridine(8) synthase ThiI [Candidatus Methanocrinis alkalitolerans]
MYLLRYSEIALKSPAVRSRWENLLMRNLKEALPGCKVRRTRGRIWLSGPVDEERLKQIFGIVSFSPCEQTSLQDLGSFIIDYCERTGLSEAETFALRLRRVGSHPFSSQEKTVELADLILERFPHLRVDLDRPEATVYVEIREDDCYLFRNVVKGVGGLPLGAEGDLVALFSGGIDSPVAAWMMMKRGCKITPIYVDLEGFSGPLGLARAEAVVERLKAYQPDLDLLVVNDGFLKKSSEMMREGGVERYTCLICKRRMYRLAEAVARDIGAKGIVTGESLGQVASQTLDNLLVLDAAASLPVYRPLIGFDKVEVEKIAREIGTFDASILPSEGCGAVPRKPATKAKLEEVAKIEEDLKSSADL